MTLVKVWELRVDPRCAVGGCDKPMSRLRGVLCDLHLSISVQEALSSQLVPSLADANRRFPNGFSKKSIILSMIALRMRRLGFTVGRPDIGRIPSEERMDARRRVIWAWPGGSTTVGPTIYWTEATGWFVVGEAEAE